MGVYAEAGGDAEGGGGDALFEADAMRERDDVELDGGEGDGLGQDR